MRSIFQDKKTKKGKREGDREREKEEGIS